MEGGVVFDIYGAATVCEVGDFGNVYHSNNLNCLSLKNLYSSNFRSTS